MQKDLKIFDTLINQNFSHIDIEEIFNYLETLEYDLVKTRYIGKSSSKNERLAKYFFLRDKVKLDIHPVDATLHLNEILDQCIDWSEFWRLLVVKKGFCCIRLSADLYNNNIYVFLSGPNMLTEPFAEESHSIYEEDDY